MRRWTRQSATGPERASGRAPFDRPPTTHGGHSLQLGVEPFEVLDVVDAGDANIAPATLERGHAMIYRKVLEVGQLWSCTRSSSVATIRSRGRLPVPSRLPGTRARSASFISTPTLTPRTSDWGVLAGHGTPMRRLIESGAVKGSNFVQVGLRGYWPPPDVFAWMQEQGMRWHLMREIEERGAEAVIDDAISEALDGADLDLPVGRHRRHRPGHGAGHGHAGTGWHAHARAAARHPAHLFDSVTGGHGHRRGLAAL